MLQQTEGRARFRDHETWYRVSGSLQGSHPPLICLHGGPGCTHDYIDSLTDLAGDERAVIHYDQIGNGRSTHLREAEPGFWTVELFLAELDNLIRHIGIARRYDVYGQSWGGMLAAEHAVLAPAGLRRLIISNSPASMDTWLSEANRLRALLPADVQTILLRHERNATTDSEAYVAAARVFYDRHLCRVPWPPEVARTFAAMAEDPTVYHTMNGPSEFHVVGSLNGWTIEQRLPAVAVPTLVISGRYDEATELCVRPFVERIAGARWEVLEHSSHLPHVEERERTMQLMREFLDSA